MNETIKRKLTSYETVLVDAWLQDGEKIQADQVCQRIEWLTNTVLDQISINGTSGQRCTKIRLMAEYGSLVIQ